MNVLEIMTFQPTVILTNASIAEAIDNMNLNGCHHLPVVSQNKHLIGVLSFHDCQRILGEPLRGNHQPSNLILAQTLRVSAAMTPAPIVIEPNAPASEAARLMLKHVIGCLPVMREETLIGIVTRSDLLKAFVSLCR
jgi:CBS domain-containing protein